MRSAENVATETIIMWPRFDGAGTKTCTPTFHCYFLLLRTPLHSTVTNVHVDIFFAARRENNVRMALASNSLHTS